ncbi:MAG: hypothetical protein ACREBQ_11210, partial [Nitrososphaerales archaeon]
MFLVLATLARLLVKEEKYLGKERHRVHPDVLKRFKRVMIFEYVVGAIFITSALPIFWIPTPIGALRFDLWYSSFVMFVGLRVRPRREETKVPA